MVKKILICLSVLVCSMYFFPFMFTFLPTVNTKKMMAVVGVIILIVQLAKGRKGVIDREMFILTIFAMLVSLAALASVVINATPTNAYVTYVITMWVWVAGAFTAVSLMQLAHGRATVRLVCDYLIAVCVMQCIFALLNDNVPAFKAFVFRYVEGIAGIGKTMGELDEIGRLYGIGAALDIAGSRFAVVEFFISYLCVRYKNSLSSAQLVIYILSFLFIGLVGNMIARTTTVGVAIAIIYYIVAIRRQPINENPNAPKQGFYICGLMAFFLAAVIFLYNTNSQFRKNIRFGFEGFFSLVEEGTWDVHSNETLVNMYKLPTSLRTWVIGDGYFDNPNSDPTYTGYRWKGFYMGTDVGYLRFLFFFGLIGLSLFILFIFMAFRSCIKRYPLQKGLFLVLLIINYGVWLKVSTDIFLVFALFLCLNPLENAEYEQEIGLDKEKMLGNSSNDNM